ncbi:MAG: DUF115 domain-containing protein [bacterium]|nr:DUF115 domain-containing protein [bacterium]
MDYYSTNLQYLREIEPELAERLEGVSPALHVTLPKNSLLEDSALKDTGIVAILGFGLGDHVKEIIRRTDKETFILVVDPDISTFKTAMIYRDLTPIFQERRVGLAISEDPTFATIVRLDKFSAYTRLIKKDLRIMIIRNKLLERRFPEYYRAVRDALHQASIFASKSLSTSIKLASIVQRNVLKNLVHMVRRPGVDSLFGCFSGIPGIIVASGPSLDKNVRDLYGAKGHALIACLDTSISTLLHHGIKPDLVVTLDPSKKNYDYYFKDIDLSGVNLVASMTTYPKIISRHKGTIFLANPENGLVRFLGDTISFNGLVPKGGGSVAHFTFNLVRCLGCDPVIFVGQDLAFDGKKTYTEFVPDQKKEDIQREIAEKGTVWVEGIDGNPVLTSQVLSDFLRWFEIVIRFTKHKTTYIDSTEGGAKIKGTHIMSLKEAINNYCRKGVEIEGIIKKAEEGYKPPTLDRLVDAIVQLRDAWGEIVKIAKQGKERIDGLERLKSLHKQIEDHRLFKETTTSLNPFEYKLKRRLEKIEGYKKRDNLEFHKMKAYRSYFNKVLRFSHSTIWHLEGVEKRLRNVNEIYGYMGG